MRASAVTIEVEDPASEDAGFCIRSYYAELAERFENGFDAEAMPIPVSDFAPPSGLMLVARLHDCPVGCGALRHHAGGKTDIKRMWVSSDVRGLGLGKRLLGELERHAALAGASVVDWKRTACWPRRSPCTAARGTRRSSRSTRSRTATTGSPSGWTPRRRGSRQAAGPRRQAQPPRRRRGTIRRPRRGVGRAPLTSRPAWRAASGPCDPRAGHPRAPPTRPPLPS